MNEMERSFLAAYGSPLWNTANAYTVFSKAAVALQRSMSKRTRLIRLLDRGFYPAELPPNFATRNFASAIAGLAPANNYIGSTISFDGATYRGPLRTFGVVNPVNHYLLSDFIAERWSDITQVYNLSSCSGVRPTIPALAAPGRAIGTATLATKRTRQQHLASVYPVILSLDINRFYGSIYTHAIPWAVLGKAEAKARHRARTLRNHWSEALDILVRNCNQAQTIGIPIGPDTSRIISEIILSRIDAELTEAGSGLSSTQIHHAIDDYQFGVLSTREAEDAESRFVRVIGRYGFRLNDFKTCVQHGLEFAPSNFPRKFDALSHDDEHFVERFFEVLYDLVHKHQDGNVIGYALKRFARVLASSQQGSFVREYLQRLLYAAPHQARFVLPLLLGIYQRDGITADTNRLVKWGVDVCARRNDVANLLWFLYSAIYLRLRLGTSLCAQCVGIGNELVDLVLFHGRNQRLFSVEVAALRARYLSSDFNSSAWLPLYEVERRGWDTSAAFTKLGTADDAGGH
ncbi:MAG: RNA-directed DNA polymerase, partial [Methylococcales bacterium]